MRQLETCCCLEHICKITININVQLLCRARYFKFSLIIYRHFYFLYLNIEGYGETVHVVVWSIQVH